jgi:hypothetical protein
LTPKNVTVSSFATLLTGSFRVSRISIILYLGYCKSLNHYVLQHNIADRLSSYQLGLEVRSYFKLQKFNWSRRFAGKINCQEETSNSKKIMEGIRIS